MKILLLFFIFFFLPYYSYAVEILSDRLERFEKEKRIIAEGNVNMKEEKYALRAEKVIYYEQTGDIEAYGNVYYDDEEMTTWAEEVIINKDNNKGILKNALIHIKKQDIWIKASEIHRLSEIKYLAKNAIFSTCKPETEASQPWCITSEHIELSIDETLIAKMATFRIKNIPVLFSPIFWGPGGNIKKSGFLPIRFGNSNKRGLRISPAYYLAIDSNKDFTFYIDYFSKIGIGKGIEYRYIDFDTKGMWYAYHIYDREIEDNFFEFRGVHLQKFKFFDLLVDINFVNKVDFYREYGDIRSVSNTYVFKEFGKDLTVRYDRFLQSSVELGLPLANSRLYLLGQAWKDLKIEESNPTLRTELGYFIYPFYLGPFNINLNLSIAEYYKKNGLKGQRFEIAPALNHVLGDTIKFSQTLSINQILYNLDLNYPYSSASNVSNREMIRYYAKLFTRFYKTNPSFYHLIEPFIEGDFIRTNGNSPIMRESEIFDNTALFRFGIYNKVNFNNFSMEARLAQLYDLRAKNEWNKLYPLLIEGRLSYGKLNFSFDTFQNLKLRRTERINSSITYNPDDKTSISLYQRYTRYGAPIPYNLWSSTLREQYTLSEQEPGIKTFGAFFAKEISKKWTLNANINYDAKGGGLRDSSLNVRYAEDCWASNLSIKRRPVEIQGRQTSELSFLLFFELKGLGIVRVYERSSGS